jgi:ABC-2 type transport system permease protein
VIGIFWYYLSCTVRNRTAHQLRRLSNPRYAVALLIGVGYFWLVIGRGLVRGDPDVSSQARADIGLMAQMVFTLFFAASIAKWWLFGGSRLALAFTPAEVQFLFPAPVARSQLILFKLLRSQFVALFSAGLLALWMSAGRGLAFPMRMISLWILFSTLGLHQLGATLVHESVTSAGGGRLAWRRNGLPIAIVVAAIAGVAWTLFGAREELRAAVQNQSLIHTLDAVLHRPIPRAALFPIHILFAPLRAGGVGEWFMATLPALALMIAHYPWVLWSDVAFEDAALDATAKRVARLAALRRRGAVQPVTGKKVSRAAFRLSPTGRPEVAIVWKNLTAFSRTLRTQTFVLLIVLLALVYVVATFAAGSADKARMVIGAVSLAWGGLLAVAGPMWIRNDLRQDLPQLEILRVWPLRGASIVAAELTASTIVLTVMQFAALLVGFLMFRGVPSETFTPAVRGWLAVFAVIFLPVLNAMAMTIHNGAALLFPAWVKLGSERPGGIEATGQGILTTVATSLTLAVMLIPPLLVGTAGAWVGSLALGRGGAALAVGAAAAAVVTGVEVGFLLRQLGVVFERTDPSAAGIGAGG